MSNGAQEGASIGELFGRVVARLREAAGYRQAELAHAMYGMSSTRLNQIERGTGHPPTLANAMALDAELNTGGILAELWKHGNSRMFLAWSQPLIDLESTAVEMHMYLDQFVPGLLQTKDYARAVLQTGRTLQDEAHLEELVLSRLGRQERLNGPNRPYLWLVIDETVIRRPIGGPDIMRQQLARLLATEHNQRISVQVLPFSEGEYPRMGGLLALLTTPDKRKVAYTEGAEVGRLIEDPGEVRQYALTYERQRARALPVGMSMNMIREAMEGLGRAHFPSSAQALRLAKVQSQQFRGRRVRGSRYR
ncbi:helix-turn-helix transcriptional regulator (plasmid) [Embleya sp. NBC_00888]|uniref:helix-turn-helix domain-containing protein n=1 Tax=Embleya sp. NBC_00888 TaxID=2975960 RepID=UPI002F912363|nr:helix-turn-helix transcriptional regulator [Embleya sp. NBC_00888]